MCEGLWQPGCHARGAMRISITCEECGHRHRLARPISSPGPVWIVCHACETPLRADPPAWVLARLGAPAEAAAEAGVRIDAWAGLFSR